MGEARWFFSTDATATRGHDRAGGLVKPHLVEQLLSVGTKPGPDTTVRTSGSHPCRVPPSAARKDNPLTQKCLLVRIPQADQPILVERAIGFAWDCTVSVAAVADVLLISFDGDPVTGTNR